MKWSHDYKRDVSHPNKIHNEKFNYIKFWCDLNGIIRIECGFLHLYRRASYKMCFAPRFYTPIKLQQNALNS